MSFLRSVAFGLVGAFASTMVVGSASAQSLGEALALAYSNNPQLNAARAQTRATDEGLGIAQGAGRPKINGTGAYGRNYSAYGYQNYQNGGANADFYNSTASFGIQLVQPIYTGGQITAGQLCHGGVQSP